jgi:HAMP domain-containing protein/putative methionine-R-sulfoxide reductase with GAF domain
MLRRISIFWIIFFALLLTSAVPLLVSSAQIINETSTEVENEQRVQLQSRVRAHAETINEQFRQFEITTNMAATRSREVLNQADDLNRRDTADGDIDTRQPYDYVEDPLGVLGLDEYFRTLTRDEWEDLGFTIIDANLEALEFYRTQLGRPMTEAQWGAYGFTVVDEGETSSETMTVNRNDIPSIYTEADYAALGFTFISGDPAAGIVTADQIGRIPSPEVIDISNVYLNDPRSADMSEITELHIETTAQLDDLFATIRSEDFGSQWVYMTTREGMMRLFPWHPNQYGPPHFWRMWQPETIVFYTAASDQGVYLLQRDAESDTVEVVNHLNTPTTFNYFRAASNYPRCGSEVPDDACALDCTDASAPLHGEYCPANSGVVILQNATTPALQRTPAELDADETVFPLCFTHQALQDGYPDDHPGATFEDDADACYIDCTDTSDPLTEQYCNVNCGNTGDPMRDATCGERTDGIILLDSVVQITEAPVTAPSAARIDGLSSEDIPACPENGVTTSQCYVDCAETDHVLHDDFCRSAVWTAPYYDFAGQGLMVTNSIPIWAPEPGEIEPIAVMSHDLRIDVLEEQVLGFGISNANNNGDEDIFDIFQDLLAGFVDPFGIDLDTSGESRGYPFLLDTQGQIIAHPRYQASQFAQEQAQIGQSVFRNLDEAETEIAGVVDEMLQGGDNVTSYQDTDGDTWIVAYAEIESTGWHLGLAQPREEIIAPATEITGDILFGTMLAITSVLIVSLLLARAITRPVSRLATTAKEIEQSVDMETNQIIGGNLDSLKNLSTAKEIANLSSVFEQMVMALQQRMVELNSIYAMGQTITANVEYDDVMRAVLSSVRSVVAYDAAEITILKGNSLVVEAWEGQEGFNDTTGRKYRIGRGPTGQIAEVKESVLISTVSSSEDIQRTLGYSSPGSEFLAKSTKIALNSFLGIPLMIGERLTGTLTMVHREAGFFTPDDERQLNKLAAQASIAIQNAIQVREREKELKQQIEELKIEIDQAKVNKQIEEVTDSDFFRQLQGNARRMRRRFGKEVEDTDSSERTDSMSDLLSEEKMQRRSKGEDEDDSDSDEIIDDKSDDKKDE